MTFCDLIQWLALTALLTILLPRLLDLLANNLLEGFIGRLCERLCTIWIVLAFFAGLLLAALWWRCGAELGRMVLDGGCRQAITIGFVLLFLALWWWLCWVARCGMPGLSDTFRWDWILAFLAAALWMVIRRCCAQAEGSGMVGTTLCARLVWITLVVWLVAAAVRYLACRYCRKDEVRCGRQPLVWTWIVALLLLALGAAVLRCCDDLFEEHELAMVGIWWAGGYEGEVGNHLRWGFSYGLPFPDDGFDLQRRETGTGAAWATLNGDRIRPALVWGNEGAVSGDMWRAEGVERLHPDAWDQVRGTPFDELVDMVQRDPYAPLYFVEEPAVTEFAVPPSNPYDTEAARDGYLTSYYAAGTTEDPMRPLAVWTWEPMTAIQTMALFPEIARLLGLYYLDRTADPGTEYDYRVVGYWADRERTYIVEALSGPSTQPLAPPVITKADSPVEVGELEGGITLIDDRTVALAWTPPSLDPDDISGPLDQIDSVVFEVQNKPLPGMGAPPSCPGVTDSTGFAPVRRAALEGGDDGIDGLEEMPPVTVSPIEDETTGALSWPDHYFFHRDLEYGCYAYRVTGRDVFGRPSPPSSPRILPVHDLTPPPPPFFVNAQVYQRLDESLPQAVRDAYLPAADDNDFALVVSWVWTDEMRSRADDVETFRVHLRHTDHDTFVTPDGPPLWRDPSVWDIALTPTKAFSDFGPLPPSLTGLPEPATGRYYEAVFTDDDVSAAAAGLDAGDTEPVAYAWVGVSSTDRAPYSNQGDVSAPVLAMARDLVPPSPPDPPPAQVGDPSPADVKGNRDLELAWPGNPLYHYQLHRVDVAALGATASVPDPDLPSCLVGERPTCDPGVDGESCVAAHEAFDIRSTAALDPVRFQRVSPLPIEMSGGQVSTTDTVDATSSRRYLYTATAVDAAGNESELSCPSDVILVPDGVAPKPPVWTSLTGGDGRLELIWSQNPEDDLAEYTVYRTSVEADAISRKRMAIIARLRDDGSAIVGSPTGVATAAGSYDTITWHDEDAEPGREYHYRLDAVDFAGNRSALSGITAGRAYDETPPVAPQWSVPATTVAANEVTLHWQPPVADPQIQILVQRRRAGSRAWRSRGGWRGAGDTSAIDTAAEGTTYEYRLRAMDPAGNRSIAYSAIETVVLPP